MAAHPFSIVPIVSFLLFSFFFVADRADCLSTVSISETSSNQTLICALQTHLPNKTSSLNCTSFPAGIRIPQVSNTIPISGIVSGDGFLCALMTSSSPSVSVVGCWRFSSNGSNMSYRRIYSGPMIRELDAGNQRICGVFNGTGRVGCWQWPGFNGSLVNETLSTVTVGDDFVCGLSTGGGIVCSGDNPNINRRIPEGVYRSVEAGPRHACAISVNDTLQCWGDNVVAGSENPEGEFTSLALGESRTCGMRQNGTVTCWGLNSFGLPTALGGISFVSIEAKRSVFCGVASADLSLYCWGNEYFDSNPLVLQNVLPGPCVSSCPCAPLTMYSSFCSSGYYLCSPCEGSGSNSSEPPPSAAPSPRPQPLRKSGGNGLDDRMVVFIVVGCVGSVSFLLVCCFLMLRYCKGKVIRVHDSGRLEEAEQGNGSSPSTRTVQPVLEKRLSHLVSAGTGACQLEEFSLQLLAEATGNFSEEFKIGSGSFGSVYHAKLDDGREVAIKRAEISTASLNGGGGILKRQEDRDRAFVNELESLSRLNHKNLVQLFGFCEDGGELILVYEYMDNGSLYDHLHKLSPEQSPLMSWPARLMVALDAARGIKYLHGYVVPPIIHRDIKSSNILLDSTWTAKVSDFGLSLTGPEDEGSHLSLHAAGTVGYVDPEYYRLQHLTPKSDVYSFGVVLLELLSGYRAIHKNENGVPRNVVDLVVPYIIHDEIHRVLDPKVPAPTPFEIEAIAYVGYLAADCVSLEGRDRPSSTEIVNSLERALTACLSQPSRSSSSTGDIHIDSTDS